MALVKTKALVIREQPYQDHDKLLTLFTEKEGKQRAIAKGARRRKSGMASAVQLFAFSEMVYYPGKNFASINEARLIESFYPLRNHIGRMTLASYITELLDVFYDFYQGSDIILKGVTHILYYLSENKAKCDESLALALQLKLCKLNGIGPVLDRCVNCGQAEDLFGFSVGGGGTVCARCKSPGGQKLNAAELDTLRFCMRSPFKLVCNTDFDENMVRRLFTMMNFYISKQLDRKMKSFEFYTSVLSGS